ncbi:MAG TPA: SMP-30/gluconolactonase/LRE family protein [Croceibacterium sp.]
MPHDFSLDRRSLLGVGLALSTTAVLPARAAEVTPRIRRLAPGLDRIVDVNAPIETIATGIQWAEGPVWVPKGEFLLFSDPPANVMRKWCRKDGLREFLRPSGLANPDPRQIREAGSNGLALDHQGRLIIADSGNRAVVRYDLENKTRTTLADRYQGQRFSSVNDVHVAKNGAIWFTDPPYGLVDGDTSPLKEARQNGVYRVEPDGKVTLIDGALTRPNGVALSPDEKQLFVSVSDEQAPRVMVYDLDAHGMPSTSRVWLDARPMLPAPGLPDGMKIAADGTHFQSVPGGMGVFTPDAELLGLIETGFPIANCAFGEDGRTLFVTANDRVLMVRLKIDGTR